MTDADRLRFEEWGRRLAHKAFGAQWAAEKRRGRVPPPKPPLGVHRRRPARHVDADRRTVMTGPRVVELRQPPPLTDIAAHLESLAKLLRNGDTVLQSVLLVCERPNGSVYCCGFGQIGSGHEIVGKLDAAKDEVKASLPRGEPEPERAA